MGSSDASSGSSRERNFKSLSGGSRRRNHPSGRVELRRRRAVGHCSFGAATRSLGDCAKGLSFHQGSKSLVSSMRIQSFLHILNPNKDHRKAVKKFFAKNQQLTHVWVERTSHPTHLETIVEWGLLQGATGFAMWGGDGSFNRMVHALFDHKILARATVSLIPVGTGNDFSRKLNFPDWKKLISQLSNEDSP